MSDSFYLVGDIFLRRPNQPSEILKKRVAKETELEPGGMQRRLGSEDVDVSDSLRRGGGRLKGLKGCSSLM